ncbi:HK97 family phage prohead protease [Micromonospora sp. NPDC047793]|uniref:HK97 family phage prohead protease n=1 Tax=Micromonospora sp. NPDC047793 TaxID=3154342 RepID=UPI0033F13BD8
MTDLTLPDLDIVRTWHLPARADEDQADDGRLATMEVRFSMFDVWYEIDSWWEGRFLERTARGSFKRTIAAHRSRKTDSAGVKVLFNHGHDFHIGDKLLGGIDSLTEESDSPLGVVALDDTSYNRDLLPGLRRGGYGSSFMFRVVKDSWDNEPKASEYNPEGLPERTIREVRLFEFGPVTWPANPDATSSLRCVAGTDAYYAQLRSRDPKRVDELRSRISASRTPNGEPPATPALAASGPASTAPTDPARGHSGGLTPGERRRRLYPFLKGDQ